MNNSHKKKPDLKTLFIPRQCTYFEQAISKLLTAISYFLSISWSCFLGIICALQKNRNVLVHTLVSKGDEVHKSQSTKLSIGGKKEGRHLFWWRNMFWYDKVFEEFAFIARRICVQITRFRKCHDVIWFFYIFDAFRLGYSIFISHLVLLCRTLHISYILFSKTGLKLCHFLLKSIVDKKFGWNFKCGWRSPWKAWALCEKRLLWYFVGTMSRNYSF